APRADPRIRSGGVRSPVHPPDRAGSGSLSAVLRARGAAEARRASSGCLEACGMQPAERKEATPMARCDVCGNDYDKAFQISVAGATHTFDSFECAIHRLA